MPRAARLMIQQNDWDGFGGAFEHRGQVANGMSSVARCPVGDAGENQLGPLAIENDVPILER
jgi:hypothetical protein